MDQLIWLIGWRCSAHDVLEEDMSMSIHISCFFSICLLWQIPPLDKMTFASYSPIFSVAGEKSMGKYYMVTLWYDTIIFLAISLCFDVFYMLKNARILHVGGKTDRSNANNHSEEVIVTTCCDMWLFVISLASCENEE